MRTSDTDPILVSFTLFSGLRGRVGMTLAPGKKHGVWARDLQTDLSRLHDDYGASSIVSLLEYDERDRLGIARVTEVAEEMGMRMFHLPIVDGGVPAMDDAIELVREILSVASAGDTVVVHCRGGLGRTGTIVACCYVAFGRPVAEAIDSVRLARPGAIENALQEGFVAQFAGAWAAAPARKPSVSRFTGCLVGGAVGDALGYPVDLQKSAKDLERALGPMVPDRLPCKPGERATVSSITQMTAFTGEGLIRAVGREMARGIPGGAPVVLLHAYRRWLETQTGERDDDVPDDQRGWVVDVPSLRQRRSPDATCLDALSSLARDQVPTVDAPSNESAGCGALVRSAPFGLGATSAQHAFELARDAAVLTHGHPTGYLSAAYFAAVIHGVTRDVSLLDAMATADLLVREERGASALLAAVDRARTLAASRGSLDGLGAGQTADEVLALTLAVVLGRGDDEALGASIWRGVAHGGPSVGSLTGSLLGAMFGVEQLPKAWVMGVELHDVIEPIAIELHAATVLRVGPNPRRYPPN